MTTNLRFRQARSGEGESLAELRVRAMRPSLEALGRFDDTRARLRFLDAFRPEETWGVETQGQRIGVFVLRTKADHLYLDHLYIDPDFQGRGFGHAIMSHIQDRSRKAGLPVRLIALQGSPANAFYESAGFVFTSQEDVDRHYEWHP